MKAEKLFLTWLFSGFLIVGNRGEQLNYYEQDLIKKLFDIGNYSRDARPVVNKSSAFQVTFDLAYSQLIDLDSKNQILSSKVWIRQSWTNPYLSWEPKEYGGISQLNMDPQKVWVPDIVLYNNVGLGKTGSLTNFDTKVVIQHDGTHSWYAPTEFNSICKIDISFFPFDRQKCPLKFGSWTYNGNFLNFTNKRDSADLSQYILSGEWDLISAPAVRHEIKYSCCKSPFIDVTFTIFVQRKVLFYVVNLIAPCIVLSALIIFSFQLPPESGERMGVVITILLGLTVFMLLLTDNVPRTSEVIPLIAKYSFVVMVEIAVSLVCTCFVLRVFHRHSSRKIPLWLRHLVFNILAPVFLMVPPKPRQSDEVITKQINAAAKQFPSVLYHSPYFYISRLSNGTVSYERSKKNTLIDNCDIERPDSDENNFKKPSEYKDFPPEIASKLDDLIYCVYAVLDHLKDVRTAETHKDEWHFVAMVMDRLFFWIFMITIISSTIAFYTVIPNENE